MNPMLQMLMGQLRTRNPKGYNMINQMMNNGANPQQILQQLIGSADGNQIQQVLQQAKSMGVPENLLAQIQNMK